MLQAHFNGATYQQTHWTGEKNPKKHEGEIKQGKISRYLHLWKDAEDPGPGRLSNKKNQEALKKFIACTVLQLTVRCPRKHDPWAPFRALLLPLISNTPNECPHRLTRTVRTFCTSTQLPNLLFCICMNRSCSHMMNVRCTWDCSAWPLLMWCQNVNFGA